MLFPSGIRRTTPGGTLWFSASSSSSIGLNAGAVIAASKDGQAASRPAALRWLTCGPPATMRTSGRRPRRSRAAWNDAAWLPTVSVSPKKSTSCSAMRVSSNVRICSRCEPRATITASSTMRWMPAPSQKRRMSGDGCWSARRTTAGAPPASNQDQHSASPRYERRDWRNRPSTSCSHTSLATPGGPHRRKTSRLPMFKSSMPTTTPWSAR